MVNYCLNARSKSKSHSVISAYRVLTSMTSNRVPPWVTGEMQKRVWDSLSKKLNDIVPGCI
jgi:hypothetical protein